MFHHLNQHLESKQIHLPFHLVCSGGAAPSLRIEANGALPDALPRGSPHGAAAAALALAAQFSSHRTVP